MLLLIRVAVLLAVLTWSTQWIAPALGEATIRIAIQSPLSEPAPRGYVGFQVVSENPDTWG